MGRLVCRTQEWLGVAILLGFALTAPGRGEVSKNLLVNGSFEEWASDQALPTGWSRYAGGGKDQQIKRMDLGEDGGRAVLLADGDTTAEIGLVQTRPASPGLTYEASVEIRAVKGARTHGAHLQLRFVPSGQFGQVSFVSKDAAKFQRVAVKKTAPAGTKQAVMYLYTHRAPTPKVLLRNASLVSGVSPPPPPPPEPIPPVYTKLKDLHLSTPLVDGPKSRATIIAPTSGVYQKQALQIRTAIGALTGVMLPIETDDAAAASVPIQGHLIVLGNRSTNKTIRKLYDLYYTLLDLRYPGPGGYVVRTLHNPFGDGRNVIFVGGSDLPGVDAAVKAFIGVLNRSGAKHGALTIGRVAEVQLGKGLVVPTDLREFMTWEASKGYRSVGYFGWNSISKRMAMYYMTGEPFHAREAIRLAFPDAKAKQEIADIDGERIENKDEPLSGPYHYNAHMMILFWDLIEESPVFTDKERLRVTNAFSKQLNHRKNEGIYGLTSPPRCVGSRHGQWSAISLYCLGRYFRKDYPNRIWHQCIEGAKLHFKPLHSHAWIAGESDNLFWYNTAIAPIFTYLTLTGDRKPVENGVMRTLLRGQEILVSGRQPDWALNAASMGFLNKAAYVMQDGRYVHYRQRTGVDTEVFRLGQSYWPEPNLSPKPPDDLVGKWSINPLPEPMWWARNNGFPHAESFLFGSYRSTTDASGDYILIDGFNGASRNPYHTFAILELRLGGHTLLKGYRNQVITRADGLVEPHIAMNAALKDCDVIGQTVYAVAEVPDAAYCNWRRTLIQRVGRYALIIDDLTFRTDAENMQVELLWETENTAKVLPDGHVELAAPIETPEPKTVPGGQIRCCDAMKTRRRGKVVTMEWIGPVRPGERKSFCTLIGMQPGAKPTSLECYRTGSASAVLGLPSPAMLSFGAAKDHPQSVCLMEADHCFGREVSGIIIWGRPPLRRRRPLTISSRLPIDVDWDLASGRMHVVAERDTRLELSLADDQAVLLDGKRLTAQQLKDHVVLPAGRHVFTNAWAEGRDLSIQAKGLADQLARARKMRELMTTRPIAKEADLLRSPLQPALSASVGGEVIDLVAASLSVDVGAPPCQVYVAEGKTVHAMTPDGRESWKHQTDGPIRMIRWWPEHKLFLVGCADEKVIALDTAGNRKWEFVSVMDPAVFRAAKTYWFKSYPGLEGIHGLYTGVFLDGKSQAFVGSACTLEILDATGKLVKRMPQFWGTPSHFAIIDGPEGSLNLLAARRWNGTNRVAIINNKTLDPKPRGFYGVPSGSVHVPGWSSMNRYHLFYEDLDGDGTKEVISEINGTWNRVTVWSKGSEPRYDASFGPGERIALKSCPKNMRDLEVADLDGDGRKEILAATSSGLIVCLDHQCKKRWATRLGSPATVMKCVGYRAEATMLTRSDIAPGSTNREFVQRYWIVAGCEDGTVIAIDGCGKQFRMDKVAGRPTCIESLQTPTGPLVLLATSKGEVKGFALSQ